MQDVLLVSVFQVPLAASNPYAKVAGLGAACSAPLHQALF